jgi:hypothetical protein
MRSEDEQLNEFKVNTNEQLKKIKKTMQDLKEELKKDIEVFKKIKWKFWEQNSQSQIKHSFKNLTKRLDQVEDRISGIENKVNELEHSDKDKEKK